MKRFRLASFLNLLGLSVAFVAFVIILMKVGYERGFDKCYPEPDRLVMLNMRTTGSNTNELRPLPRGVIDYVSEHIAGIERGSIFAPAWNKADMCLDPDNPNYFYEEPWGVYPDFPKTVGMQFVEGDGSGLKDPESVLISESQAKKLFPKGNALGAYLYIRGKIWTNPDAGKLKICGIYKDFPENSQLDNVLYMPLGERVQKDDWGSQNYFAFFRLKKGVTYEDVDAQLAQSKAAERMYISQFEKTELYVIPVTSFYYHVNSPYYFKTGSVQNMFILISIAILIIVIASINLINFSTALTPMRMRSINTQKVLGSSDASLRTGLVAEAACITFLAWIISLGIILALHHLHWLSFLGFEASITTYWQPVVWSGLIALAAGIVAGLYPAFYMTSFPPALVLKGNYALSGKGKRLRTALIGLQYIISFVLMVVAGFIYLQNNYMRAYNLGIEKDRLVVASLPSMPVTSSMYQGFGQQLKSYPEIEDIAYSKWELGASNGYTTYTISHKDKQYGTNFIDVTPNFCKVMGMDIIEGRDFLPSDSVLTGQRSDRKLNFIGTRSLRKAMDLPAGETFKFTGWDMDANFVGYVNDVQFTSVRYGSQNYVFCCNSVHQARTMPFAYIRIKQGGDIDQALAHIRKALGDNFVGYPTDFRFFDQVYNQLYQKETNQQYVVSLFSLLAILISLVGVFGLVIFEAEYRRKEIGVRKVYGATTGQILWMFNRSYLKLIVTCSVISSPVAWYIVSRWLQDFDTHISITPWMFLLAFVAISVITFATITIQNYRFANSNPVDSLKSE